MFRKLTNLQLNKLVANNSTAEQQVDNCSFQIFDTLNSLNFVGRSVREDNSSYFDLLEGTHEKVQVGPQLRKTSARSNLKFLINKTYNTHINANTLVIQNYNQASNKTNSKVFYSKMPKTKGEFSCYHVCRL
jgi:hypothetical protein